MRRPQLTAAYALYSSLPAYTFKVELRGHTHTSQRSDFSPRRRLSSPSVTGRPTVVGPVACGSASLVVKSTKSYRRTNCNKNKDAARSKTKPSTVSLQPFFNLLRFGRYIQLYSCSLYKLQPNYIQSTVHSSQYTYTYRYSCTYIILYSLQLYVHTPDRTPSTYVRTDLGAWVTSLSCL